MRGAGCQQTVVRVSNQGILAREQTGRKGPGDHDRDRQARQDELEPPGQESCYVRDTMPCRENFCTIRCFAGIAAVIVPVFRHRGTQYKLIHVGIRYRMSLCTSPRHRDAWVDPAVEHIHGQTDDHEDQGAEHDDALNDRNVVSTTTEPASRLPMITPTMVRAGIDAVRSAWRSNTRARLMPRVRALSM